MCGAHSSLRSTHLLASGHSGNADISRRVQNMRFVLSVNMDFGAGLCPRCGGLRAAIRYYEEGMIR